MIYVIKNGHISFRQQLRQHDGAIKNATVHSGPADPMLGNSLYKDVQKLAQVCLLIVTFKGIIDNDTKKRNWAHFTGHFGCII